MDRCMRLAVAVAGKWGYVVINAGRRGTQTSGGGDRHADRRTRGTVHTPAGVVETRERRRR
eukprot:2347-Eustigmatos_ZCMA.PRE.1